MRLSRHVNAIDRDANEVRQEGEHADVNVAQGGERDEAGSADSAPADRDVDRLVALASLVLESVLVGAAGRRGIMHLAGKCDSPATSSRDDRSLDRMNPITGEGLDGQDRPRADQASPWTCRRPAPSATA